MNQNIKSPSNLRLQLNNDAFTYGKKRKQTTKTILTSVVSIVTALIVALLVATTLGYDPINLIAKLFYVGFNDPIALVSNIGVFCFAGFAFAFASKAGLFNIGVSGQMLASGTFIVFLTTQWIPTGMIPNGAGQIIILFAGMIIGGLIATIIGTLDVYLRINSVVSSILLNWIIYFVSFFLLATYAPMIDGNNPITNSLAIPDEYRLWFAGGTGGIIPIIILIVVFAVIIFIVFKYTVFGHKIKSVGLSPDAAKYAGYNVNLIRISSFAISGAIAGVLACILYTTKSIAVIDLNISVDTVPIEGFNGIAISLIGNNNPLGIIMISFIFGLFQNSIPGIVIPPSYINVLLGLLMLGSALTVVVVKYKPWKYIKSFKYDINYYKEYQNFENRFDSMISKYKSIFHQEKLMIKNQTKDKETLIKLELNCLKDRIKELRVNDAPTTDIDILKTKMQELIEIKNNVSVEAKNVWVETYKNISEDYATEKYNLLESWKFVKVQMLIDKYFKFDKIVEQKESKIANEYDSALIKKISHLQQSNKINFVKIKKIIKESREDKKKDIVKIKTKQSKYADSENRKNRMLKKIGHMIDKIHNQQEQETLIKQIELIEADKGGE